MKLTLTLALAILLLAATGWGETNSVTITTNNNPVIDAFTQACSTNGFDTSGFIRKLAASGEICKVFGHWYPNVWIGEHKCVLCGKVEPNWRDK